MAHSRFLLSLSLLVLNVSTFTSASAAIKESSCTNFTFPEDGGVRELCFSVQVYGPSPFTTTFENGTEVTEYVGESSETDMFEGDLEGLVTEIKWEEAVSPVDCVASVTMNNETMECSSCALCEDKTSVSADCTNLDQGRNVACGENAMVYFISDGQEAVPFFPFVPAFEYTSTAAAAVPAPAPPATTSAAVLSCLPQTGWWLAAAAGVASTIITMAL